VRTERITGTNFSSVNNFDILPAHSFAQIVLKAYRGKRRNTFMQKEDIAKRSIRGCQEEAFARALQRPMTSTEIFLVMKRLGSKARRWDVSALLKRLTKRGLVRCVTRVGATGNVFFWTELGKAVPLSFGVQLQENAEDIDWKAYSSVVRSKIRRMIIMRLNTLPTTASGMTAEELRRTVSTPRHSIGLRSITRGLNVLQARRLVEIVGHRKVGNRKVYHVTEEGRRIAAQLAKSPRASAQDFSISDSSWSV